MKYMIRLLEHILDCLYGVTIAVIALPKLLSCSIIKAGPWLTLPLIYMPMLLLRLKAWGYSSAVSGGLAVAQQNNFYHDAQLDHLETRLNLIVFLTPQS